jgi:DNA-binding LytR/AlgR family response regulator
MEGMNGLEIAMSGKPALRTLLVDDEPIARRVLREELDALPGVDIVGEADHGEAAIRQIHALRPDLVFLDLQMPGLGGFEVVENLEGVDPMPSIVIVTALDQHALRAFEAGAIDYLLKPVGAERLERCLDRIRQRRTPPDEQIARLREIAAARPEPRVRKIVGKAGEEYHLLDCGQILAFQAEGETVWIVTRKQRYQATQPLKQIEEKLAGFLFARIHRNALVNLDHVSKMAPLSSHRWMLTLSNGQELIVSKRQAARVQELLRW